MNKQVKEHIKRAINSNGVTKRIWSGAGRPALLQYRKIRSRLAHRAELRRWDAGLASLSESGVLPEQAQRSPRLIVSLTSFPKRMHEVVYTVYSLLTQTMKPDIVCLWLSVEEFPHREADLPEQLLCLLQYGLTIKWCHNIRSYKKLIPARSAWPEDIIITVDDDILYPSDLIERLYRAHLQSPKDIIARRAHQISCQAGKILPYTEWQHEIQPTDASYWNFQTGAGSVLYPPGVLHPDLTNESLFTSLCPMADDIWFWAMAVRAGTKIVVPTGYDGLVYTDPQEQVDGTNTLAAKNVTGGQNDVQLRAVLQKYPEILLKLRTEKPESDLIL